MRLDHGFRHLFTATRTTDRRLRVVGSFRSVESTRLDLAVFVRFVEERDQLRLREGRTELNAGSEQALHSRRVRDLPCVLPVRLDVTDGCLRSFGEAFARVGIERTVEGFEISGGDVVHAGHCVLPVR